MFDSLDNSPARPILRGKGGFKVNTRYKLIMVITAMCGVLLPQRVLASCYYFRRVDSLVAVIVYRRYMETLARKLHNQ